MAADRRAQFEKLEYTDEDYQKELEHIEEVKSLFFSTFNHALSSRIWVKLIKK